MKRRGFVGALGALVSMGRQPVPLMPAPGDSQAAKMVRDQVAGGIGAVPVPANQIGGISTEWIGFRRLMKPHWRRQQRRSLEVALLGGLPPHVASCHSWAPWFRAQRAAAWAEDQMLQHDLKERAIRKAVGFLMGDEDE